MAVFIRTVALPIRRNTSRDRSRAPTINMLMRITANLSDRDCQNMVIIVASVPMDQDSLHMAIQVLMVRKLCHCRHSPMLMTIQAGPSEGHHLHHPEQAASRHTNLALHRCNLKTMGHAFWRQLCTSRLERLKVTH